MLKLPMRRQKKHPDMYAPLDESVGGGPYGDDDATDEFYWAACELFFLLQVIFHIKRILNRRLII